MKRFYLMLVWSSWEIGFRTFHVHTWGVENGNIGLQCTRGWAFHVGPLVAIRICVTPKAEIQAAPVNPFVQNYANN